MSEKGINTPVIRLDAYKLTKINFEKYLTESEFKAVPKKNLEQKISLQYMISDDSKHSKVKMNAHIVRKKQQQVGDIEVIGFFSFRSDIVDERQKAQYSSVNGGAMLYPYLRAAVSMITALDNNDVTVLPSLNFMETFKDLDTKNPSKDSE